jgi:xanthine dehydrogenase YagR molybdenum-binding subunit
VIPRENHNPIEMHATIAAWEGDRLTLWDKTQWVNNVAEEIAAVFGIPGRERPRRLPVRGRRLRLGAADLAARDAGRARRPRRRGPVKLMLSRREMYYGVGYRPHTVQRVALGASREGRLEAIVHDAIRRPPPTRSIRRRS